MRGVALERKGQRWHLLNPSIENVIMTDEAPRDSDSEEARTDLETPPRKFFLGA